MTSIFTQTFGGSAVSPADVAFASYSFSANLTLFWPQFSAGQTNVAARFMNLTATANSLNVSMPDATLVSVGYDVIIFNAGSDTFNIVDFNGGAIATIPSGQTYYIILNDNTTQSGGWQTVQFGVGTGSASAAALAGAGLLAAAGLLNVNLDATIVNSNYTITSANLAILQVWTGGTGTISLPPAATVGDGFFFPLANNGSGNVTVVASGSDQIDGASTSVFSQTQSGFVISSGAAWYTVGKGIQNTFAVTLLNLNVAGSSDVIETSAQAQNIIQQYTGILTGNINVIVPNTVQLYYVFNNTSGAFTLTVKTASGTGITVAQGAHSILYCDGTNVLNAFTSTFGGSISISPGSANAPNLNIVGSSSTGIYSPSTGQIAFTAGGFEVMNFTSVASSVNYLQSTASATGSPVSISALGSDTNVSFSLSGKGTGTINISKANITGGSASGITLDNSIIGGTTAAAITGTTIKANTGFTGNVTGNVTGNITGSAPAANLTGTTMATGVVNSSLTKVGALASGSLAIGFTPVTVPLGGTGLSTLTANNVILGNGASSPTFVAPGTSGNILTSNGSTWASAAAAGGTGRLINIQVLSGSGTYTKTAGTNSQIVKLWGDGAGGGTGSPGNGSGSAFGALSSGGGVTSGSSSSATIAGGSGSGGNIMNATGSSAGTGNSQFSGFAGAGALGGGAGASGANGTAGGFPGGGGGSTPSGNTNRNGSGGGYCENYYSSAVNSVSYSIGSGGSAGTNGFVGGAGTCIVYEYS